MNNYALKKILPRIIIVAILINLSFIISQLLIDLSNIAGAGVYSMFDSISSGDTKDNVMKFGEVIAIILAGSAAIILAVLFVTVPVFLAMLLAILITMVIIVGRQAGIIILTVIAPLAFLAMALPNTEPWFNKWRKMYIGLLLVYPTVALLFAGGKLTSVILANSSQGLDPPESFIMQVVSMGVAVIPLIMLPALLKGSMSSLGAIGTKLSGMADGASKRVRDKMGSTSLGSSYKKQFDRHNALKRAQIQAGISPTRNPFTRVAAGVNRGVGRAANSRFIPGKLGSGVAASGVSAARTTRGEDFKAQQALLAEANGGAGVSTEDLSRIIEGERIGVPGINPKDPQTVAAAMAALAERGEYGRLNQAWDHIAQNGDQATRNAAMDGLSSADGRPAYFGARAMQEMRTGPTDRGPVMSSEAAVDSAILSNTYSAESMATASREELVVVADRAHQMHGSQDIEVRRAAVRIADNAIRAQTVDELKVKIGKNVHQVNALASNAPGARDGGRIL